MTETDSILDAIERRIVEANAEIASLIAARGALIKNGATPTARTPTAATPTAKTPTAETPAAKTPAGETPAGETRAAKTPGTNTAASDSAVTTTAASRPKVDPAANGDAAAATTAAVNGQRAEPGRRPRSAPRRQTKSRAAVVVPAGKLEVLLADSDGLSAAALARRAGGSTDQVLTLLRELEQTGKVGRSGEGRATRWRWITDEERIESRAAELEAQFKAVAR